MDHARHRPNQQILDEAAEWFVDFREGDLDLAAQQAFSRWLRRSPEHIKAYLEVAAFWADVPSLASREDVDVEALIAYARAEDNVVPLASPGVSAARDERRTEIAPQTLASTAGAEASETGAARPLLRRMAIAASIAVVIAGAVWFVSMRAPTYATGIGEQRSVLLIDGSTVELNAKSRVRVRFNEQARDVELVEGQALFRVAKQARPFIVHSGDARVRAVGTQFDVYRKKSGTTVTVVEGRVAVFADHILPGPESAASPSVHRAGAAEKPAAVLSAGEQVVVSPRMPVLPKPADIPAATAWAQRQIVFQSTPLGEVVEEFNRYNLRPMVIDDAELANVRISGVFSSTEPASLLRFLREQVRLDVSERDESIQISRGDDPQNGAAVAE